MAEHPLASPDRDRGSFLLALAEWRAGLEASVLLPALPFLSRTPRGDGHTVLVYPGWLADDASTLALRAFLWGRGYRALGWGLGRNRGGRARLLERLVERVRAERAESGARVSLIGWSLGGIYAREIARTAPELVRCVVTLASPFQRDPRQSPVWPLIARASRNGVREPSDAELERVREPPPVPTTAVYSVSDGVVAPRWCRERAGPLAENIELPGSHLGMGVNPLALFVVADRLAELPEGWRRFDRSGLRALFYREGAPHPG
jgi:pimeloyl-ACP methyl ester carboxylesterase